MEDIESAIAQAFDEWMSTWDLADMTLRDVYEAGFRHGHKANNQPPGETNNAKN